jgi:hypothetical protein
MPLRPRMGDKAGPYAVYRSLAILNDILGVFMLGGLK